MQGNPKIQPPAAGEDVRELWKKVAELVEMHNRPWAFKPDGAGKIFGSKENIIVDMSGEGGGAQKISIRGVRLQTDGSYLAGTIELIADFTADT